jgi:hypothetical protein
VEGRREGRTGGGKEGGIAHAESCFKPWKKLLISSRDSKTFYQQGRKHGAKNIFLVVFSLSEPAKLNVNFASKQVSWMRIRDLNVLTMNELTNTKDQRIKAIHVPNSDR